MGEALLMTGAQQQPICISIDTSALHWPCHQCTVEQDWTLQHAENRIMEFLAGTQTAGLQGRLDSANGLNGRFVLKVA